MSCRRRLWRVLDSNQRRQCRQIYSLLPLATRATLRLCRADEGNRTPDLRFTKPVLYRLSYVSVVPAAGFEPAQ